MSSEAVQSTRDWSTAIVLTERTLFQNQGGRIQLSFEGAAPTGPGGGYILYSVGDGIVVDAGNTVFHRSIGGSDGVVWWGQFL